MGSVDNEGMEKYGVVLDEEKTKTAETGNRCPKCGMELSTVYPASREMPKSTEISSKSGMPWCSHCGTEPFEAKE